jgi:hypothetical protein
MTQIYLAFDGGLAILRQEPDHWLATLALLDKDCHCLAVDPHRPQRVYCGAFADGLWLTDNAGETWQPVIGVSPRPTVTAVAVSPLEEQQGFGVVWVGTEPSALFRAEEGGYRWQEKPSLLELPSQPTWSFPPRPWTHHVRWIEPDATVADQLFVGIELGGVMRSLDDGATWEDRKPGSQHDCHTLRTHPLAPGLVYEAAGGGFAASHDGGATWQGYDHGLRHHYLWGLAVDPANPTTVIVSASPGPGAAHNDQGAAATLYRRTGDSPWQPLTAGLPATQGTRAYVLATNPAEPGVFYAATRHDLYRSTDAGLIWEKLPIVWPDDVRFTTVNAMVVTWSL